MNTDREMLINAVNTLEHADNLLFESALNIEMNGDCKEITESFEIGETFEFNLNMLLASKNINVKKIAKVLLEIDKVRNSIININAITEKELE